MIKDVKRTVLGAYSMWANYLGILCLIFPEVVYWGWGIDTNPRVWWLMALFLLVSGTVGRVIGQNNTNGARRLVKVAVLAVVMIGWALSAFAMSENPGVDSPPPEASSLATPAEFLVVGVPFVSKWEGLKLVSYQDIVDVWTVCYGETKGVVSGDQYTLKQCNEMLERELIEYRDGLHKYFNADTLTSRLPVERDVAFTSLAYNVGISGAGGSTAVRRLNASDIVGGCEALRWWNKAGGRVIRGLSLRRGEDYDKCMVGVLP